jgi:hypothetical protein
MKCRTHTSICSYWMQTLNHGIIIAMYYWFQHHNLCTYFILSSVRVWLYMGFGLVIGFIEHFQTVTTSNYSAIANSYALQFTTACAKSSQSVFTSCFLVPDPLSSAYVLTGWRISQLTKLTAKLLMALASRVILGSESYFIVWRLWEPSELSQQLTEL